jgi:hypothetical protein
VVGRGVAWAVGREDPYALRYTIDLTRRHLPLEREGPTVALVCGVLMLRRAWTAVTRD